jgi:hypothetical protein
VLDAPSNLGLRPPRPLAKPGCKGPAAALQEKGIVGAYAVFLRRSRPDGGTAGHGGGNP